MNFNVRWSDNETLHIWLGMIVAKDILQIVPCSQCLSISSRVCFIKFFQQKIESEDEDDEDLFGEKKKKQESDEEQEESDEEQEEEQQQPKKVQTKMKIQVDIIVQ